MASFSGGSFSGQLGGFSTDDPLHGAVAAAYEDRRLDRESDDEEVILAALPLILTELT